MLIKTVAHFKWSHESDLLLSIFISSCSHIYHTVADCVSVCVFAELTLSTPEALNNVPFEASEALWTEAHELPQQQLNWLQRWRSNPRWDICWPTFDLRSKVAKGVNRYFNKTEPARDSLSIPSKNLKQSLYVIQTDKKCEITSDHVGTNMCFSIITTRGQ